MGSREDQAAAMRARGELVQMVFGHMSAHAVATAARLGLMDLIGKGGCSADELARECGAHTQAMLRLLRALAALELLTETQPGRFAPTPVGALLRTDRPDSAHSFVRMFADPAMLRAWEHLDDSVRTGRPSFDEIFGADFFAYLKANPKLSTLFNAAMSELTRATADVVPTHYDFDRYKTVVDVGGGDGTLLAAILHKHPAVRGVVFDTPDGLAHAPETLRRAGVAERCSVEAGDFFASVYPGADLYILKSVIHDWDDARAARIPRHCREAVPADGRLLVIERVLPPIVAASASSVMYLSDLNMLVNVGGRERTRADFEELCERAGFSVTGITPLPPPVVYSLIDARPT